MEHFTCMDCAGIRNLYESWRGGKGLEGMQQVDYGDVERIRQRLGMNKMRFRKCIGVSRTKYWRWKHIGVEGPAQQLLKVIDARPDVVVILEGE